MRKNGSNDFSLLAEQAALIVQSAEALRAEQAEGKDLRDAMRALHRRLMVQLEREFVPPMERRDLADLGGKLFALAKRARWLARPCVKRQSLRCPRGCARFQ